MATEDLHDQKFGPNVTLHASSSNSRRGFIITASWIRRCSLPGLEIADHMWR
jgi:hypothetical protein